MTSTALRAAELARSYLDQIQSVTPLSSGRHDLYRVSSSDGRCVVVKFSGRSPSARNFEADVHRRLAGNPAVRRLISSSVDHLVVEYAPGSLLADLADEPANIDGPQFARQLVALLRAFAAEPTHGYGNLGSGWIGVHPSWSDHLAEFLRERRAWVDSMGGRPFVEHLRTTVSALQDFLELDRIELDHAVSRLVPIDLNLHNLVVNESGLLTILDLEACWLADPLLALGEWTAHTHGTFLHRAVLREWGPLTPVQRRHVHFYALLATLDIQLFIAHQGSDPSEAVPWGNRSSFTALADVHRRALDSTVTSLDLLALWPEWVAEVAPPDLDRDGVGRVEPLAVTRRRLSETQQQAGITRVADIMDLDETGVHVHQAVRPDAQVSKDSFTVFSGRGATALRSTVSAIAEAIERLCAERTEASNRFTRISSAKRLRDDGHTVIGPEQFNLPAGTGYNEDQMLEWVQARDLCRSGEAWIPACAVFYPYPGGGPLKAFSTGLGAGQHPVEAVAHGLSEVIERDAAALNRILRDRPAIRLDSIDDGLISDEIGRIAAAGLDVVVRSITRDDVTIPTFSVLLRDRFLSDSLFLSGGYGSHPDKAVALTRALREAAASRVGTISGAREDLGKFKNRTISTNRCDYWFDTGDAEDYSVLPSVPGTELTDDVATMADAILAAGLSRILLVDLSRPELGLTVVKILVPGIERYSFRMQCVGRRARVLYRAKFGRDLSIPPLYSDSTDRGLK